MKRNQTYDIPCLCPPSPLIYNLSKTRTGRTLNWGIVIKRDKAFIASFRLGNHIQCTIISWHETGLSRLSRTGTIERSSAFPYLAPPNSFSLNSINHERGTKESSSSGMSAAPPDL